MAQLDDAARVGIGMRAIALAAALALSACNISREDLPWEPLSLEDPIGMATPMKLANLRDDAALCAATLSASNLEYAPVEAEPAQPECALDGAVDINQSHVPYGGPVRVSCPLAAALYVWEREVLAPAAAQHLGATVERVDHLGTYSCRRLYNRDEGGYSQHATANAIDVAGFRLSNGERVVVAEDWNAQTPKGAFLRAVHEGGCDLFRGVLGPDYNAAHTDHFHLDMGPYDLCR